MSVRLTSLSHGAGCGCKLPASELHQIIRGLPGIADPRVLVGAAGADDAAVYRLTDDLALVQTVDFFTPIVDDPYAFGRIAATNALSDVYAMGGRPIMALNLVAFPLAALGREVLGEIMRGADDAVRLAGASIAGGHSIDDPEPKFGLAVSGLVHPDEILTNAGGRAGDLLVLSKPLGTGVVSTATKRGLADPDLVRRATEVMCELNREAAEAARRAGAHALTDITGFGLLGHLHEMARASGLSAEVDAGRVPAIAGVLELLGASDGAVAGGTRRNRAYAETFSSFSEHVGEPARWLVCDAMTSGGLLAAVAPERADAARGVVVGRLKDGPAGQIDVV